MSQEQALSIIRQGDEGELWSYLEHHRERSVAKAAQLRSQAKQTMIHEEPTLLLTSAQWVAWLDNHNDSSKSACRQASLNMGRCSKLFRSLEASEGPKLRI